jgi:hypothetical protein
MRGRIRVSPSDPAENRLGGLDFTGYRLVPTRKADLEVGAPGPCADAPVMKSQPNVWLQGSIGLL